MISIELLIDNELIDSILDKPEIYQMVNGTPYTKPFNETYREELINKGFQFLGIFLDQVLIGLFSFREVTSACVESHIHIIPEYHKKGYGNQAVKDGIEWFKCNKKYRSIVTYVPSNCFHVLKFMKDNEFQASGKVLTSVIYKNELVDLFLFSKLI